MLLELGLSASDKKTTARLVGRDQWTAAIAAPARLVELGASIVAVDGYVRQAETYAEVVGARRSALLFTATGQLAWLPDRR